MVCGGGITLEATSPDPCSLLSHEHPEQDSVGAAPALLLKKLPLVNIWDVPIASCELCIHLQGHLGTPKGLHNLHKCFLFLWTSTESKYCYRDIRANDLLSPSFNRS